MNIKATVDGKELEFEVLGTGVLDHHDADYGMWGTCIAPFAGHNKNPAIFLRLIRKTHTFGGVVFEEVEVGTKTVHLGEWYLDGLDIYCFQEASRVKFGMKVVTTLRPVKIED